MSATGGTVVDKVLSTLRVISTENTVGENTGALVVEGGMSILKDVFIKDDLYIPSGTITTGNLRFTASPVIDSTLICIDTTGTVAWDRTRDYRMSDEPNGIGIHGYNVGIGVTNTTHALAVSGSIEIFSDNIYLSATETNLSFTTLKLNSNVVIDVSGNTAIGTSISEQLNLSGNLRVEGNVINNNQTFTFPSATDTLVGISNTQRLSNKTIVSGVLDTQLDANNVKIVNLATPTLTGDATNKAYVDALILGIDWKPSVLSKSVFDAPSTPSINDSYLVPIGATGVFAAHVNDIATFTASGWGYDTPTQGSAVFVEDIDSQWNYNSTEWVLFGTLVSHSNLINLSEDDHTQYLLLDGRESGQLLIGGTGDLTILGSKNNGTILLGTTEGRVGINVTAPTSNLHIRDTLAINNWVFSGTSDNLRLANDTITITETTAGTNVIAVYGVTGNLGIGVSNPAEKLEISGGNSTTVKISSTMSSAINLQVSENSGNTTLALGTSNVLRLTNTGTVVVSSGNVSIGANENPDSAMVIGGNNLGAHSGLTAPSVIIGTTGSVVSIQDSVITSTGDIVLQSNSGLVGIGVTTPTEKLDVLGNIKLTGNLHKGSLVFRLPSETNTLIGTTTTNDIYNKNLDDTSTAIINTVLPTRKLVFDVSGVSSAIITLAVSGAGSNTVTVPDITDTLVTKNTADILRNKQMSDSTFSVVNNIDTSKSLTVDVSGNGSNVTTQLVTTGTTNRVLTLPDITDTLVTKNSVDILQNKTFISPSVSGVCTFESDIVIQGNIYQFGDTVILDNTVLSTGDNLIKLASNNTLTDITDTGVYSVYSNIGVTSYTGLFRDATDKIYKFFDECTIEPETTIGVSFAFADVRVNKLYTETVSSASNLVINDNVYITNNGKIGINVVPTSTLDVIGSANFNNTVGITTAGISINKTDPVANLDVLGSVRVENTNVNITLTGTASVSGTTVTGSGTVFTTEVLPGDSITINAETRIVSSITNDTELVVSASMTTVSGVGITLHRSPFQANDILINTSGYIGLGTKFPAFPLQIDSNSASWSQKITNNNSTIFLGNNSGEGLNINTGTLASSSYSVVCSGISGVLFKVQTDGKVAINSGTPSELLDVSTNIAGQGAQIGNAFLGVWLGSNAYTSFTHSALKANSTGYSIRQHSSGDTAVNAPTSKSIFFNIADTNKMIIDPSGNVGIGTGSPDATLNVDGTGHFTGNLTIDGNVYISGTSAELHTSSVVVDDSLIKLADNNTTDAVDIGIYGQYNNSGIKYSGMFRDHTDGVFKIFHQLSVSPGITSVPFAGTGYTDADLRVGNFTATGNSVISGGQRITPTIVTGNVTLNNDYNTVLVNGTVTVTLPQARSVDTFTGVVFTIINIGVGVVTIQVSASDTIDNQVTSHFLYSQYDRSAFYNIGSDISNSEIGVWLTM